MNGVSSSIEVVPVTPWWETVLVEADVLLGCLTALAIVGFLAGKEKEKREGK